MDSTLVLWFALSFGFNGVVCDSDISVTLVGQTAEFRCQTSSPDGVMWDFIQLGAPGSITVYNSKEVKRGMHSKYLVYHNPTTGISHLVVRNVQRSDAGSYKCTYFLASRASLTTELVVLASGPVCSLESEHPTLKESDDIVINCSVCYIGALAPTVRCLNDRTPGVTSADFIQSNDHCSIHRKRFVADRRMVGSTLRCSVAFVTGIATHYSYTWTSPYINVTYGPSSVAINAMNRTLFRDGDVLTCTSDSNPEPTYQWTALNIIQHGSVFTVDVCKFVDWKTHPPSAYVISVLVTCVSSQGNGHTAADSLRISVSTSPQDMGHCGAVVLLNTSKTEPSGSSKTLAIIVVVAVVVVLLVLIIVVVVSRYKQGCRETKQGDELSVAHSATLATELSIRPSGADPGLYEDTRSSTECLQPTTVSSTVEPLRSKPYEDVKQDSAEQPRPPTIYSRLSRHGSNAETDVPSNVL